MPRRLLDPGHNTMLVIVVVCLIITFSGFAAAGAALLVKGHSLAAADTHACRRTNKLYNQIQNVLKRSRRNTPKLMYYQKHPTELASVLKEINKEIKEFRPENCSKLS